MGKQRLPEVVLTSVTQLSGSVTFWIQAVWLLSLCSKPMPCIRMKYFQCPEQVLDRASNLRTLISPKAQETTEGILKALLSPKSTPMTIPSVNYKPESNATFFLYLPVLREILCVNLRRSKPSLSVGPLTPSPIPRDHPISPPPARLMGELPRECHTGACKPTTHHPQQ